VGIGQVQVECSGYALLVAIKHLARSQDEIKVVALQSDYRGDSEVVEAHPEVTCISSKDMEVYHEVRFQHPQPHTQQKRSLTQRTSRTQQSRVKQSLCCVPMPSRP
jgi:hypothetical protein